jgi:hypothetical protein
VQKNIQAYKAIYRGCNFYIDGWSLWSPCFWGKLSIEEMVAVAGLIYGIWKTKEAIEKQKRLQKFF